MESARESHIQKNKGKRVLLFPLPLQGHLNPMLQLANILYSNGFSITVIHTEFNTPKVSNYPYFTFHSIPDRLLPSEASTGEVVKLIIRLNTNCAEPLRESLGKILSEESDEGPVACLITDCDWWMSQSVADSFKLPRIVLRTSSIFSFLVFAEYPSFRENGYFPLEGWAPSIYSTSWFTIETRGNHFYESRFQEPLPGFPPLKVRDIPMVYTSEFEEVYAFFTGIVNSGKVSAGIIWNTSEVLDEDSLPKCSKEWGIPLFPIGPFLKLFPSTTSSLFQHDLSSISWLDKQPPKSVIYVSFGSIIQLETHEFLEVAWGLANSNQRFLWVIRPKAIVGGEWNELLPKGFLENLNGKGHIVEWAPQVEVLAHPAVGGFWTHGGWNSTLEGICAEIPMICFPREGDQTIDSRYISDVWKIGLYLDGKLEKEEITKAIRTILTEKEGQEMKKRIHEMNEKLDEAIKPGGSSHRA